MKTTIQGLLIQALELDRQLSLVRAKLGRYEGEQLTEDKTEEQLDRWTRERDIGEAMDATVAYMDKVLKELRWIFDGLDS